MLREFDKTQNSYQQRGNKLTLVRVIYIAMHYEKFGHDDTIFDSRYMSPKFGRNDTGDII